MGMRMGTGMRMKMGNAKRKRRRYAMVNIYFGTKYYHFWQTLLWMIFMRIRVIIWASDPTVENKKRIRKTTRYTFFSHFVILAENGVKKIVILFSCKWFPLSFLEWSLADTGIHRFFPQTTGRKDPSRDISKTGGWTFQIGEGRWGSWCGFRFAGETTLFVLTNQNHGERLKPSPFEWNKLYAVTRRMKSTANKISSIDSFQEIHIHIPLLIFNSS